MKEVKSVAEASKHEYNFDMLIITVALKKRGIKPLEQMRDVVTTTENSKPVVTDLKNRKQKC